MVRKYRKTKDQIKIGITSSKKVAPVFCPHAVYGEATCSSLNLAIGPMRLTTDINTAQIRNRVTPAMAGEVLV